MKLTMKPLAARTFSPFLLLSLLSLGAAPSLAEAPPLPTAAEWQKEYGVRRAEALKTLAGLSKEGGLLLLRAHQPAWFAGDVDYLYRPDNQLFYLSGIPHEGATLLLSSKEIEGLGKEVLFIRPEHPGEALWVGKRLSAEEASEISGIPAKSIVPIEKLGEVLRKAARLPPPHFFFHRRDLDRPAVPALVYNAGLPFAADEPMTEEYGFLLKQFGGQSFHLDLRSPAALLNPMRQIKSPGEVAMLRKAIDATCKAQSVAMQMARAGLHEYHLATEIEATYRREGCSGWSFPSIIGSGPNSCVLHYMRYDRRLEAGDVVVMDIGAEFGFYAADVTRTIPVSGRFTERQRAVYQVVYEAQEAVFKAIKPGLPFGEVNRIAKEVVAEGLIQLKLIDKKEEAGRYLPHGISHGLGMDVHDPMPIETLKAGMVITVEPGIYIAEEALGVRIEDDVLVTETGCEVLSRSAPRQIEEVERRMRLESF